MRIISGTHKGRRLFYDKTYDVRPTQDRVREALFSMLGQTVEGASFLDLCCGCGSVGLEASSRGASTVVFVDITTDIVKKNCRFFEMPTKVIKKSVLSFLKGHFQTYDIIYLDPPYQDHTLYNEVLTLIKTKKLLRSHGKVVVEHHKSLSLLDLPLEITVTKKYGSTYLTFLSDPSTDA